MYHHRDAVAGNVQYDELKRFPISGRRDWASDEQAERQGAYDRAMVYSSLFTE
jgi:hypothetical protein